MRSSCAVFPLAHACFLVTALWICFNFASPPPGNPVVDSVAQTSLMLIRGSFLRNGAGDSGRSILGLVPRVGEPGGGT
eukprot:1399113-Rhodomonas_salina.3